MPLSLRLYSVVIRVRDLEKSRQWCEEALGLGRVYRDLRYRLVTFGINTPSRLTIWEISEGGPPACPQTGGALPVFVTDDVDREHDRLAAMGVAIEPIVEVEGGRWFRLKDPDGNHFGIAQLTA